MLTVPISLGSQCITVEKRIVLGWVYLLVFTCEGECLSRLMLNHVNFDPRWFMFLWIEFVVSSIGPV